MKALLLAIEIKNLYNKMALKDVVAEFEEHSGQTIPQEAVDSFLFTGLNNVDILTSDYLNSYGLKNLYQSKRRASCNRHFLCGSEG